MAQPTEQDVDRIIEGYNNVKEAKDYGDSLVFEVSHVADDDYKFVWSTEYNGGFQSNA